MRAGGGRCRERFFPRVRRSSSQYPFSYAVGRFLRIIPLFYFVVFLYYCKGWIGIVTSEDLVLALTFESDYGHLWTIPAEFKFYFILPFIAYAIIELYKRYGVLPASFGCLVLMVLQQLMWPFWLTPENSIDTRWYLYNFTMGSLCSVIHHRLRHKLDGRMADVIGVAVVVLIAMSFPYPRNILFGMPIDKWLMNKFLLLSPLRAIFILVLADGKGYLGGILKTVVLRKLGDWSYSIYLIHIMVYAFVGLGWPVSVSLMLVGIICSVFAGALLYYCFEGQWST